MRRAGTFLFGGTLVVAGLMSALLWRTLPPALPDWRLAFEGLVAEGACYEASRLASDVAGADVIEAAELFQALAAQDPDSPCRPLWRPELANSWPTEEALLSEMRMAAASQGAHLAELVDQRRWAPGRIGAFFHDLAGRSVTTSPDSVFVYDAFDETPLFARWQHAWWQFTCGHALGRFNRPRWVWVESTLFWLRHPDGTPAQREIEPWYVFEQTCAASALDLARELGLDAPGQLGDLAEHLLFEAQASREAQLLSITRALIHGKFGYASPQTKEERVAAARDALLSLGLLTWDEYGPALSFYGRLLLNGGPPDYEDVSLVMIARDPPLSDGQYAYGLLLRAQAAGEEVEEDLARAEAGLTDAEKAEVMDWVEGE